MAERCPHLGAKLSQGKVVDGRWPAHSMPLNLMTLGAAATCPRSERMPPFPRPCAPKPIPPLKTMD